MVRRSVNVTSALGRPMRISEFHLLASMGRIPEDGDPGHRGDHLLEELQPLAGRLGGLDVQPRDVSLRPREVGDLPDADGVGASGHDRDRPGRPAGRDCREIPHRTDDVDLETHEIRRQFGEKFRLSLRRSDLDDDVLPLDPAQLAEFLPEGNRPCVIRTIVGCEEADPVDLAHRLCVSRERRTQEAEDQSDHESEP